MGATQSPTDKANDLFGVVEDLPVFDAQNRDAQCMKEAVAFDIARRSWKVRCAIGLDDEPGLLAVEVDDERAQGLLASELGAVELTVAQKLPEDSLGRRRRASQCTSSERWVTQQPHEGCSDGEASGLRDSAQTTTHVPSSNARSIRGWLLAPSTPRERGLDSPLEPRGGEFIMACRHPTAMKMAVGTCHTGARRNRSPIAQ